MISVKSQLKKMVDIEVDKTFRLKLQPGKTQAVTEEQLKKLESRRMFADLVQRGKLEVSKPKAKVEEPKAKKTKKAK